MAIVKIDGQPNHYLPLSTHARRSLDVPERVAIEMRAMFDRYNVVNDEDLLTAMKRTSRPVGGRRSETS